MSAGGPSPEDGVVVYRATRQQALDGAVEALIAAGIPAVAAWRGSHSYAYVPARAEPGEGEVVIPAGDAQRARAVLQAWEDATQARIREHLRDLPRQLRRFGLIAGLCLFGLMSLTGEAWRVSPMARWLFVGALAVLLLWEIPTLLRARRERAERERVAPVQPPRWFER